MRSRVLGFLWQAQDSLEPGAGSLERVTWRWRRQMVRSQTSDFSGVACGDNLRIRVPSRRFAPLSSDKEG